MRIRIINKGIHGAAGPIPVGAEFTVQSIPETWADKVEIIADVADDAEPVTNPARRGRPRKDVE